MLTESVAQSRSGFMRLLLAMLLLGQLLAGFVAGTHAARAEGFVSDAFQNQWNSTDAEVANGKVARTFFWGPQAFAHTQEVYSESPTSTREVQYFDKGRMELTRKTGLDPNLVTNGLLTIELVSGKMQVGDNTFMAHTPATNPVAGDPSNNEAAPTYASFNKGKLAYGVADAISATDRTGQNVDQKVDKDGVVANLTPLPATVTYSHYVTDTKHNIANVFYNFFLNPPLGNDKWLPLMGFPISEPYWTTAMVAGQNRAVLVQLFERRALTYTPDNPTGFQVEMANIGQHYYSWRYGVALHNDVLPGNYRLLWTQGNGLYSSSISKAENFKLVEATSEIRDVFPNKQGLAAINVNNTIGVVDLVAPGEVKSLPIDDDLKYADFLGIDGVSWSANGQRLAVAYTTVFAHPRPIGAGGNVTVFEIYDFNGSSLVNSFKAYGKPSDELIDSIKLSPDGQYLAFSGNSAFSDTYKPAYQLGVVNISKSSVQYVTLDPQLANIEIQSLDWVASTGQLLVSYNQKVKNTNLLALVAPDTAKVTVLSSQPITSATSLSPDGNDLAILSGAGTQTVTVSFRAMTNPTTEIANSGPIQIDKDYLTPVRIGDFFRSKLLSWSVDSSYVSLTTGRYSAENHLYSSYRQLMPLTAKTLFLSEIGWSGFYNGIFYRTEESIGGGPHFVIHESRWDPYNYIFSQDITVQNTDGSNSLNLYSTKDGNKFVKLVGVVQIPLNR